MSAVTADCDPMLTAVSVVVRVAVKLVLLARKYWVPLAVVRPPLAELMSVPPVPVGLVLLIMMPMLPVVVAAFVEVSLSKLPAFQSKARLASLASPSVPVVVVVRAVPSARLKIAPALTCKVPVEGMLAVPLRSKVPAFTLVPPAWEKEDPVRVRVPRPFLVSARLFSFVPPPPRLPPKVFVVPTAMLSVNVEFDPLPPTTDDPAKAVVVSPASVWLLVVVPPRTSLPVVPVSPKTTEFVAKMRLLPASRTRDPFLTVVVPVKLLVPLSTSVPLPACVTLPAPLITLAKSVPWVMVSVRLNASVPAFEIVLSGESEPVEEPAPICSVPPEIVVAPV